MRNDPEFREPRAPAVAIWTVVGLFLGVAVGVVIGQPAGVAALGAVLGLLYGLFATRRRPGPIDDD